MPPEKTTHPDWKRPHGICPRVRQPKHSFGVVLKQGNVALNPFKGFVDAVYADYWSAVQSFIVPPGWFEMQNFPPSTKDQVFYSVVGLDGQGSALIGENEAVRA